MRRIRRLLTAALCLALALPFSQVHAHDETEHLDLTFGAQGKTVSDFTGGADVAQAMAVQADGKIVVAGSAVNTATADTDFGLARYNSDGTLDASFGDGGKVITDIAGLGDTVWAIALQADGKIVVAGQSFTATNFDFALARYNSDGTLDASFGDGGKVLTDFIGNEDIAFALLILPDGKLVVAGHTADELNDLDFALARFHADGSLDTSFGKAGKVITDFFESDDQAFALARQADGKLVAAGAAINPDAALGSFALARYDSDGALDATFNGGKVIATFDGGSLVNALAIQADGKIVAAGVAEAELEHERPTHGETTNDFALARFHTNGTLDTSFGASGKVTTDFVGEDDRANDIAIQTDGKILVAGTAIVGHREDDGHEDRGEGKPANQSADLGKSPPVRPADHEADPADFAVARYHSNGSLDHTFGNGGKAMTEVAHDVNIANAVAIQSDGRILAAGQAGNPDLPDFGVVRYLADGFDICIQDEATGSFLRLNSATGAYRMQNCSKGFVVSGAGAVTINGCKLELRDAGSNPKRPDRQVRVEVNRCTATASASVQMASPASQTLIHDNNINDNSCECR